MDTAQPSTVDSDGAPAAADPWAHRRGEPRLFAFFWALYVLVSVGGSVLWLARTGGWMLGGYGPAGRIMLVVVAAGATLLWPMTRLSQASPGAGSIGAVLADAFVVLLPIQMVVWPMTWMAGWPLGSVAGIAALFGVWIGLAGGVLAAALGCDASEGARDPGLPRRAAWMLLLVMFVLGGALPVLGYRGGKPPDWVPMLSPFTGILALTGEGVSGPREAIAASQWMSLASVGVFAMLWWVLALGRAVGRAASLSPSSRAA